MVALRKFGGQEPARVKCAPAIKESNRPTTAIVTFSYEAEGISYKY